MYVEQFFIDGLGCASYLIGCEAKGEAAVIDPDRDVRRYLEAAEKKGLQITHIIETHLHADHVSGNTDLAQQTGAKIYLHADAQAEFPHETLQDGDVLELGAVRILARHTPGHTPESLTLFVADTTRSAEPWMALTGDLLFVGDVGRPDLVGQEAARGLAGQLYDSLFGEMLKHDDGLLIYPGHGAGSLCGRSIGSVRATSLGFERHSNPSLSIKDRARFVEYMTSNLPEQPGNHSHIKGLNRKGPRPLGQVQAKPLSTRDSITIFQRGAALLDTRSKAEYVEAHVPGSVHLPVSEISSRVGFVLPPSLPVVLLLDDPSRYPEVVFALARVGFEKVEGFLAEGMPGWQKAGLPVASGDIEDVSARELDEILKNGSKPLILDVREPWEYAQGHIPGAKLMPLGQLSSLVAELEPSQPVAVVCASGNRSQSAASLLGQKGFTKIYNLQDGMYGWQSAGLQISTNGNPRR
jgi:hydroxyacylglutathione hydrolase